MDEQGAGFYRFLVVLVFGALILGFDLLQELVKVIIDHIAHRSLFKDKERVLSSGLVLELQLVDFDWEFRSDFLHDSVVSVRGIKLGLEAFVSADVSPSILDVRDGTVVDSLYVVHDQATIHISVQLLFVNLIINRL